MYAYAHFRYVTCSVRVCTDLLSWMAGRAGAGRLIAWGIESGGAASPLHNHIDGALQMPVEGRTPSSVPRAAGHPFLATAKMQKINGYWCSTGLCFFDQTFQKLGPLSATIQENGKFAFFVHLGGVFYTSFLPIFCDFLP